MPKKVKLEIVGISNSQSQAGTYAIVLSDKKNRNLPIIIGATEAQSIATIISGVKPQRPLTHDLFSSVMGCFNIELLNVHIYKLDSGIFYAYLNMVDINGGKSKMDSRTSDAIAMAIRFGCPIFIDDDIMDRAAITMDDNGELAEEPSRPDNKPVRTKQLFDYSEKELSDLLEVALSNEDYERASEIRDILNSRK